MSVLNAEDAINFFNSYGLKVDKRSVIEWVREQNEKSDMTSKSRPIVEEDLYRYNDWCMVKGTAYEVGINNQTKISRLLEENSLLKQEIEKLKEEKQQLENLLGLNDWI
ncbi:hypothetical protein [Bacillus sp. FJAT-47783]|uniref:hypothetical protein n=1 Tax=Bacillus sp. FJAT-47783 TaxID=2922712 RepID=UPI001FAE59A1|nr:hypothetical protein [Bacillus sp. FJAT-47783]